MVEPIRTAGRDVHRCDVAEKQLFWLRRQWRLASRKQANIDAAISSVLSNLANFLSLKHQRTLSSASRVGFDVSGWSSTSIKMTVKWFIQSYASIFDKAQPSETTLQWSDPRWMSGARRNEINLARVRLNISSTVWQFSMLTQKWLQKTTPVWVTVVTISPAFTKKLITSIICLNLSYLCTESP